MPKPFMCLPDGESLLQKTFQRAAGLPGVGQLLTVTNREVFFRTLDDYRALSQDSVELAFILEPSRTQHRPGHCRRSVARGQTLR